MKYLSLLVFACLTGCSPSWSEGPYEIYWIDGVKTLGYYLGEGAYIGRIDGPVDVSANDKFISIYACPEQSCAYYYIDRQNDHKFAEANEFVAGPYTKAEFLKLTKSLSLPELKE